MTTSSFLPLLGLCIAGLLVGLAARRTTPSPLFPAAVRSGEAGDNTEPSNAAIPQLALPRSTETLASLLATTERISYARLAKWLVDASAEDISSYWDFYKTSSDPADPITKLIFLQWTRLDPQAAIAKDSSDHPAWWAWACHDPQAALTAAVAAGPELVTAVVRGLAEFHPDWLRRQFSEIPQDARQQALSDMAKFGDVENPQAMIQFSLEQGKFIDPVKFKALIDEDPWSALDRASEFREVRYGSSMTQLIAQLAGERPDVLARMASQAPSGSAKRKMETALFQNLLKSDPETAIAQALASEFPRQAAERLAAVSLSLMKTDPARAKEMAGILLDRCPDGMMRSHSLKLPGKQTSSSASSVEGVSEMMKSLLAEDPDQTMDMIAARGLGGPHGNYMFEELGDEWRDRDLMAYSDWVKRQTEPAIRNRGVGKVIQSLTGVGDYRDAADWALSLPDTKRIYALEDIAGNWRSNHPDQVLQWLETAALSDRDKEDLLKYLRLTP